LESWFNAATTSLRTWFNKLMIVCTSCWLLKFYAKSNNASIIGANEARFSNFFSIVLNDFVRAYLTIM
jgi:hypothetical protein